jgi:hypothetical protein
MKTTIFNEYMMKEETYELCYTGFGLSLPTLEEMGIDKNKPMRLTRTFFFKENHSIMNTPLSEIERVITEHYDIDDNMIVETNIRRVFDIDVDCDGVVGFTLENLTEEVEVEEEVIAEEEKTVEEVVEEVVEVKVEAEIKDFIENRLSLVKLYAEEHRLNDSIDTFRKQHKELKRRRALLKLIPFKTAKIKDSIELLEEDIIDTLNTIIIYQNERAICQDRIEEHLDKTNE